MRVRDLAAMSAFYREVLGLPHLFDAPPGLAFFQAGTVRIMLARPEAEAPSEGGNSLLYFRVSDLPGTHAALAGRGAAMEGEPHLVARLPAHELWMSFCRDPEGNLIGLMSEIAPAQSSP